MNIKIRLGHPDARMPVFAHADDAGADLHAVMPDGMDRVSIYPGQRFGVPTGVHLHLPTGYEAQIRSRSGLALKHGVAVLNAPGTIDPGYRGEIVAILINHGDEPFVVRTGDRVAQMIIARLPEVSFDLVETLEVSERGESGLGSTGIGALS